MILFFIISMLGHKDSQASTSWRDLEVQKIYQPLKKISIFLNNDISTLPPRVFNIAKTVPLTLLDQIPLDQINVQLYQFQVPGCSKKDKKCDSEVQMLDADYGVKLNTGCVFEVYVENKDLFRESIVSEFSTHSKL